MANRRKLKPASSLGVQGAFVAALLQPLALLVRQVGLVASAPQPSVGQAFHATMQREGQGLTPLHPQAASNYVRCPFVPLRPSTSPEPFQECATAKFWCVFGRFYFLLSITHGSNFDARARLSPSRVRQAAGQAAGATSAVSGSGTVLRRDGRRPMRGLGHGLFHGLNSELLRFLPPLFMDKQSVSWCQVLAQWMSSNGVFCVQVVELDDAALRTAMHGFHALRVSILDRHGDPVFAFTINGETAEELFDLLRRAQACVQELKQ